MTRTSRLSEAFARNHPAEMASFLAAEHPQALIETVLNLPDAAAAAVVSHLPHGTANEVLNQVDDGQAGTWLAESSVGQALNLVLRLDPSRRAGILQNLPDRAMRTRLERLVVYPRRTLGALVDATAIRLHAAAPLHEAVSILRGHNEADQGPVWVVDESGRFLGQLDLVKVVLASRPDAQVRDCTNPVPPLLAESSLLAAHDDPSWLHHLSLPVVDYDGHLLGSVSREQLIRTLAEEAPEPGNGLEAALTSMATEYLRFLATSLGELLQRRPSP
jgi:magnesium transporter